MNRKQLTLYIVYYLIVLFVYWYTEEEHPPLKAVIMRYVFETAQSVARTAGRIGLRAEAAYYREVGV